MVGWLYGSMVEALGCTRDGWNVYRTQSNLPPAPFQTDGGADHCSKRYFLGIGYWLLGIENLTGHVNKKPRTRNKKLKIVGWLDGYMVE